MTRIVEKPSTPVSRLANIGVAVHQGLEVAVRRHRAHAEAAAGKAAILSHGRVPVHGGPRPPAAHRAVAGWYDCGKVDNLLETNQHLLEHGSGAAPRVRAQAAPSSLRLHRDGVTNPRRHGRANVSIEAGSFIAESTIANSILGRNVRVCGDGAGLAGGGRSADRGQDAAAERDGRRERSRRRSRGLPQPLTGIRNQSYLLTVQ